MTDIVTRLRRWAIATDAVPASDLMDEAADAIEKLRWRVMTLMSDAQHPESLRVTVPLPERASGRGTVTLGVSEVWDTAYAVTRANLVAQFSPGSRTGPINRTPERESPRRECWESSLRDVARPDTKGKVAGGPEHHISDRSQPVKDDDSDRSKPISDNRLSALEELSAMDQELELEHGITGNPMIKARRNKESAGAGITDAGPRLRQMNDVLKENERLRGQLAWTERERDSLRVSINNLRDYVAELNAELFAASAAKTDTTPQRNGALSDSPDPDSRVWETPRTPPPQATPQQGSVPEEDGFLVSRNAKEPVAWAVLATGIGSITPLCHDRTEAQQLAARLSDPQAKAVPLYRHSSPTLTDAEREAVAWCRDNLTAMAHPASAFAHIHAATLRGLLERTK